MGPTGEARAAGKVAQDNEQVLGDATGEGEVDGADLALLWMYLTAFPFLTEHYDFDMLDIDRDGDNDWDDLYILGKHLYATPTPENTYRIGEPLTRPDRQHGVQHRPGIRAGARVLGLADGVVQRRLRIGGRPSSPGT